MTNILFFFYFFSICHIFSKSDIPKRLHGINAPVCIIYGVIGMHAGCQLLCIDWMRSKISLSDQGRDRERLKDLRLHLPMNIWCLSEGERQWSSVRSSRCRRKSTLSASGHISTVSYVNAPPCPPHAEESCGSCVNGKCSFHLQSMPACFFFLSSLPQRQNTITDSCFLQRVSAAPYCLSAKQILDNCLVETWHL